MPICYDWFGKIFVERNKKENNFILVINRVEHPFDTKWGVVPGLVEVKEWTCPKSILTAGDAKWNPGNTFPTLRFKFLLHLYNLSTNFLNS